MNASKVYASLGYPKVTYNDYSTPYVPGEANLTLYDYTDDTSYPVGTVEVPAVTLNQAVDLAAAYAKLDLTNYTLGEAVFVPGSVFNGIMIAYPTWALYFAQIQGGYWIYGDQGPYSLSLEVDVDALTGTVLGTQGSELNLPNSGQYSLSVSSSTALETVRASNLSGVSPDMTENGTVSFMEPRVVVPGRYPTTKWFDSSLSGSRLLWIIDLDKSDSDGVLLGTFVVDGVTGELIAGTAEQGYATEPGIYSGSIDFPSADNLVISQESIEINGSIIGMAGSVHVSISNVLVAKPGSSGSVEVNLTALDTSNPTSVTLSFVNPLPGYQNSSDGSPPGVSLQFSKTTLTLPANGSAFGTLLISVDRNAPPGTYMIEVDVTYPSQGLTSSIWVSFFLSVWDGTGEWPLPPIIR